MLVEHERIYLDSQANQTDALLVRDGRIAARGDEARALAGDDEVVRPEGRCVFPALTDAHIHLWGLGLRAGAVSLRSAQSTEAIYRALEQYELEGSPSGWVLGTDWDQHLWEDADELSFERLNAIWPDTPVVLRRVDGHAIWVNRAALESAGVSDDWDPGQGGSFVRREGTPTGLLVDDAMHPVLDALGEPDEDEDRATFLASARRLLKLGITCAHKAWMPVDRLQMLEKMHGRDELPIRLHLLFDANDDRIAEVLDRGPWRTDWISAAGMKFFADGAMGSQGAYLLGTYPDGSRGLTIDGREHLLARVPALAAAGWQVAVHAIGDAGARNVLDSFEACEATQREATRPRLEHAQMLEDSDLARLGELGVIASIQPIHMYSDAAWLDDVMSDEQLRRLFRWRDLWQTTHMCGGSDYPIEDPNPWHGISVASSRLDRTGREFGNEQALSRHEALHLYTDGAAWAGGWEGQLGRLEPGYLADFIVLDRDPFESSDEEIWDTDVLATYLSGRRVM